MIELLVSMAITSMLMLALLSLVGNTSEDYTRTQRALNTLSQARSFLQFFDREVATRLPGTPLVHENGTGSDPSDKLAFVRAISADEDDPADPGDLNTSAYYVAFSADSPSSASPKLFRKNLKPKDTQTLLEGTSPPPFPTPDPATDEPLVPYVLDFQSNPKYRDDFGTLVDWDATSPQPPSLLELKLTFIDDTAATRFKTEADWKRLASSPRPAEVQLVRTFTRNISLAK